MTCQQKMAETRIRPPQSRRLVGYSLFFLFFAVFVVWLQLTQLHGVYSSILPLDVIQGNPSFQKLVASFPIQADTPTIGGEHETTTTASTTTTTTITQVDVISDKASTATTTDDDTPRGVFVLKTTFAEGVLRTVCTLDRFFNKGPKYAIRIIADHPVTKVTLKEFRNINPDVDLQVIVDRKWTELPTELSPAEREEMEANCTVMGGCTVEKISIGYVYMEYWRYRQIGYEESLKDFEYFISIDGDAYLTRPWEIDPFRLMHDNNLTGFYVTDGHNYGFDQGIEETTFAIFGTSTEGRGYLNSPDTFPFFENGKMTHRSLSGYFYGGRLDFFRLPDFREFSRRMVPYTYRYRVDEQVIIASAWSMMAADRVWHLPSRGYRMGVYHHSVVDDERLINCSVQPPPDGASVFNDTMKEVCYWSNPELTGYAGPQFRFPGFYLTEPHWVNYNDLVLALLVSRGGDDMTALQSSWGDCYCQPTKEGSYYDNQC